MRCVQTVLHEFEASEIASIEIIAATTQNMAVAVWEEFIITDIDMPCFAHPAL